ncbi:CtsR family transcriptional regulator [Anaerococcus sp. Marseille-P9784]|uniref:CtsR family transcriptional regulator n=1 Tax=Anaerococcus sp. Marseille-P9784 TaxID=2614127 RepID=UPI001249E231|nr:CtsR family transcriptional regulator [Anaerococcus sp. Marseille-P9784]
MAGLTSDIEEFLKAMLNQSTDGMLEIGRNDLAIKFDCAPSQINYVLSTRFTPHNGYLIESKRGGNGFIKIITIVEEDNYLSYLVKNLNEQMTEANADSLFKDLYNREYLNEDEFLLAKYATSDKALAKITSDMRNFVRSDIIKNMILSILARS